ncbi:MAG: PAS domain S-box protein, partial [Mariniphaga sp.]|nr:PAS domain S-box protein [Mariniphaga sp.]
MKFILEKRIALFYLLLATALISILLFFFYNSKKVKLASNLVEHTHEVIRVSDSVLLDILDLETGSRGYLLTGNDLFLEPYVEEVASITGNLAKLALLINDNPIQQARVSALKKVADERMVLINNLIKTTKLDTLSENEQIEVVEQGKILTDSIRNLVLAVNIEEFSLLNKRKVEIIKNNTNSELIFLVLIVFIIFIFVLIFMIVKSQTIRNRELEKFTASKKLLSNYSLSLIEASLDPLITINTEGKITDMNEALASITGLTRKELTCTNFFDYFTEPQKAREVYEKVFANGSVADSPLTLRHKDGKLTDVLFNGSVYKDDRGNVLGAVVVARDIAEQKWATELRNVNMELAFQNREKEKRAAELGIANVELAFQNEEKEKRAAELLIANKELLFQNEEKEKRAAEFFIANKELLFQNDEKQKRADELSIANDELAYQNQEKENRAAELLIANKELTFQNDEKEKRAAELLIANDELHFQNEEKEKRDAELSIANTELLFQNEEKEKRAAELIITDNELIYQTREKEKQEVANVELEAISDSLKLASQYSLSLIEASRDPLVTINTEGKITDMNEALVIITGISRHELIGTDFLDYFTEPQKAREVYQDVFAKGSVADSPLTLRHKGGKLTDVLFNGSVYKDDKGNVLGVVIVARDVTAQKLASQYARSLIEASLDPLFTINPAGKITDMNEASINITGMSRDKLIGTDFFDYFTEPQKAREVYQEVFANGFVTDYPLTIKDEDLTDILLNGSVYTDDRGNVLGVVVVARDITDQKRIEK